MKYSWNKNLPVGLYVGIVGTISTMIGGGDVDVVVGSEVLGSKVVGRGVSDLVVGSKVTRIGEDVGSLVCSPAVGSEVFPGVGAKVGNGDVGE